MRDKAVNVHVQKVENGYVVAADFDRYDKNRKITTVETSRDGLDNRLRLIFDDLDTPDDE